MTDSRTKHAVRASCAVALTIAAVACSKKGAMSVSSGFPGPGLVAWAIGSPQLPAPLVQAPSGFNEAVFYRLSIQGIPVGTAVVSSRTDGPQTEFFSEIKVGHRLGYAPLISGLRMTAKTNENSILSAQQFYSVQHQNAFVMEDEVQWNAEQDSLRQIKGNPENYLSRIGLKPAKSRKINKAGDSFTNIHFAFFEHPKSKGSADPLLLNPLNGKFFSRSETAARFAGDGFADTLKLPWFEGISLEFTRDTEEAIQKLPTQMSQAMLELEWFSTPESIQEDLRKLQTVAANGVSFARNSEKIVRKTFPQLPYLFHRKLFNFSKLCERLNYELSMAQSRRMAPEQVLSQMGWLLRNSLSEDHRELPRSLVNSPELEILADDAKKWQWARIMTHMLTQTNNELRQVLAIEDSQKVNVAVRMNARHLARGSVVKGMLRSGALHVHHQIESAGSQPLNSTSLVSLPLNFMQPMKVAMNQSLQNGPNLKATAPQSILPPFEFINGQSFAKGDFQSLSPLCETFRGRVGLDLGNSKNDLFASAIVRGVWDESTRVQLIRQFARQASANPSCRDIVLRAPGDLTTAAKSELESFRRDILQTEMEFQISVGSNRSLRLVPGKYDLVISSLVNGSILGKREIIIPQGHENLVLNLQL